MFRRYKKLWMMSSCRAERLQFFRSNRRAILTSKPIALLYLSILLTFPEISHAAEGTNSDAIIFQSIFALGLIITAAITYEKIKIGKPRKLIFIYAIAGVVIAYALACAVSFIIFVSTFHT